MSGTKVQQNRHHTASEAVSLDGARMPEITKRELLKAGAVGALSLLGEALGLSAPSSKAEAAQLVKEKISIRSWVPRDLYDDDGNKLQRESIKLGRGFLSRGDALAFIIEGVHQLRMACAGRFPSDCDVVMIAKANNGSRGQYVIPMDKLPGTVNPVTLSRFRTDRDDRENQRLCEEMLTQFKQGHLEVLLTRDPNKNAVKFQFCKGYRAENQNTDEPLDSNGNLIPGRIQNQVDFILEPKGRRR